MTVTQYVLRIRFDDSEPWGEPTFFETRKERDQAERVNRVLGGIRTWSYEEKVPSTEGKRAGTRERNKAAAAGRTE